MGFRGKILWVVMVVWLVEGCSTTQPTQTTNTTTANPTPTQFLVTSTPTDEQAISTATLTPSPNPTKTQKIKHLVTPENPPGAIDSIIQDPDSSPYANSKMVAEGDYFDEGLFERPFNSQTMDTYFPDLDITQASLRHKGQWIFATITLHGLSKGNLHSGSYGIEIDLNQDGRGDFLIYVQSPGLIWSTNNVKVLRDANHDVGGKVPVYAETDFSGDGFEQVVFDSGVGYDVDAAWARIMPDDLKSIQIAFKTAVIDHDRTFYWRAWAQRSLQPGWFDYNDHFTLKDAGSPLPAQSQAYPLASLAEVDNTCRWGMGVIPPIDEPGICTSQLAGTPSPEPMILSGLVWYDRNTNHYQDPGEPGLAGATVTVSKGDCAEKSTVKGTMVTQADGLYQFTDLQPGYYCVEVSQPPPGNVSPVTGTGPTDILLKPGRKSTVNFPFVISIR